MSTKLGIALLAGAGVIGLLLYMQKRADRPTGVEASPGAVPSKARPYVPTPSLTSQLKSAASSFVATQAESLFDTAIGKAQAAGGGLFDGIF